MSSHPRTRAVRAGIATDRHHGAVVPPLHLSTNFTFEGLDRKRTYDYSRSGNPTRDLLAVALTDLEGGAGAVVTSSGMAAITLALQLLQPGDLVLAPHDCYGGTYRALDALAHKHHFDVVFLDQRDSEMLDAGFARGPRMVWVETPSNPLLRVTDIAAIVRRAGIAGSLVVVDNTFLSPVLQRPLELGADIVVHSTTKYLNGHSDVVGGAVIARTWELAEQLTWWGNCLGLTGSPFDAYLTLRGVRTLHPRMRVHEENATAIAELLVRHPAVAKVYYPGLPDHDDHALARVQQQGFGGMLSFELRGGRRAVERFLDGLEYLSLAESLGGVESLIAHPATMTHAAMEPGARRRAGITDALLRISAGIEDAADLCADIERALRRCVRPTAAVSGLIRARGSMPPTGC